MPMQDNINEIYRMRQEAYDRKRKEFENEIKQCDLNMLAMSKDKSEPDEVFRAVYLQRCELLRQYREKYGKKAEYQLRDQLDEARTKLLARMHGMEEEEATDKMTESYIKQISEDYRAEIERLKQLIEIKDKQIDEYQKILKVQEQQTYMQKELILNLKYLLNAGK